MACTVSFPTHRYTSKKVQDVPCHARYGPSCKRAAARSTCSSCSATNVSGEVCVRRFPMLDGTAIAKRIASWQPVHMTGVRQHDYQAKPIAFCIISSNPMRSRSSNRLAAWQTRSQIGSVTAIHSRPSHRQTRVQSEA